MASSSKHLLNNCRKIVAIGRNFADHAKELGNAVPQEPFFFLKPTSSLIRSGANIEIPYEGKAVVHHEIELGVIIGPNGGRDIPEDQAMNAVGGYIVALDLTARELQNQAKSKGKPWAMSKGFDTFCPISDQMITPKDFPSNPRLWCKVNGELKQDGPISDMIFPIEKLIAYVSQCMTLQENDIILTGTPAGVGPIKPGDVIEGGLDDLLKLKFDVAARLSS